MTDSLTQLLADLPRAEPDPGRAARVRSRCHAALAKQRRRSIARPPARRVWEPLVAGIGGIYLAEIIRQALALWRG